MGTKLTKEEIVQRRVDATADIDAEYALANEKAPYAPETVNLSRKRLAMHMLAEMKFRRAMQELQDETGGGDDQESTCE